MTVGRETSHDLLFAKPIRDRLWYAHPRLFIHGKQDSDGWSARRDAGASGPGPSEVEGTWHPGGGPSGRGRSKGGAVGVWPERGAPPCGRPATLRTLDDSEPDRVRSPNGRAQQCETWATLSRNEADRQNARSGGEAFWDRLRRAERSGSWAEGESSVRRGRVSRWGWEGARPDALAISWPGNIVVANTGGCRTSKGV